MVASFEKSTKSNPFNGRLRSGKIVPEYIPNSDDWGVVESGAGVTAPNKQPTTVLETANWLTNTLGISPLPNCPQHAEKFGVSPKSPCSMGWDGDVRTEQWKIWQKVRPPFIRQAKWWDNAKNKNADKNGIGAIAGLNHKGHYIEFIDIDAKHFDSQVECDRIVQEWEDKFPVLKLCLRYRTPGGGYRYIIALSKKDEIFACVGAFNFEPDQEESIGEILHNNGGHSLFPPSIRADGKSYYWDRWVEYPPVIDSYESIGLFPKLKAGDKKSSTPNTTPNTDIQSSDKEVRGNKTEFDQLIKDINAKLELEEAFNWTGHNFIETTGDNGKKLKGNCPWHDSTSGTAFFCERLSNGNLVFNCPSCGGGNIFDYRHSLNAGSIVKARGKAFTGVLRELAGEAGLDCGFLDKPKKEKKVKSKPPENTDDDQIEVLYTTVENACKAAIFKDDWVTNNGSFYNYTGQGYWQRKTEDDVRHTISLTLEKCFAWKKVAEDEYQKDFRFVTKPKIDSTYGVLKAHNHNENTGVNNRFFRCFNNCVLDLRSGKLLDHQKELLLTSKLDVDYNPGSDCPDVLKQFICKAYGENKLDIIRAVLATFLNPSAPYGIFLYVTGKSGSGKGTLLRFISSLFHNKMSLKNFSIISNPDKLHQFLRDCDICLFPDVSSDFSGELETFYELVDNGESGARRLYSDDGYQKKFNTRFAVGSVNPIRVENAQGGWARRALILKTNPLNQKDKDYYLEQKLAECKAEAISWAMGLDAKERDRIIHEYMNYDEDLQNIKFEHEITSDSIKGFIDSCLRPTDAENPISTNTMYFYYKAYCFQFGYRPMSANTFKIRMKGAVDEFFFKGSEQKRVKGSNQRYRTEAAFVHLAPVRLNTQDQGRYSPHNFEDCTFVSTSDGGYRINPKYCINGGLEAIYTFMEEKTLKIKFEQDFVTPVTGTAPPENVAGVTAEKLAMTDLQDLSQLSQLSQGKILLSEKFENSHNDHSSDPIKNDHIYRDKKLPCDKRDNCDKPSNPYIDSLSAVTHTVDGGVAAVVTTVTNLENSTDVPNAPSIKMQLGEFKIGDRTLDDLISQIKVVDPREQKQKEFTQEQLAENQIIEDIKSQILGFTSSKDHLDLRHTLDFQDFKAFRAIRAWLIKGDMKSDGTKESILPREFVDIWLS